MLEIAENYINKYNQEEIKDRLLFQLHMIQFKKSTAV